MTKRIPLMPKGVAMWLIDNTSLTFKQIADFCCMHILEVEAMADDQVARGLPGNNPIISNQLTKEEILRCEQDESASLQMKPALVGIPKVKVSKAKYTPISKRQDKPNAIYWIVKNYPQVSDRHITKLLGTTKSMIESIRSRSHWNIANMKPRDPVLLGICSQRELDSVISQYTEENSTIQSENKL